MREIKSKEEVEKKESKNKTTLGIILAVLMIMSTAGYALLNQDSSSSSSNSESTPGQIVEYKGVKFEAQLGGLWKFNISGQAFYTSYTPEDVKKYSAPFINTQSIVNQPMYYSGSPLAVTEIVGNLQPFILRAQEACHNDSKECEKDLPVKDCTNNFIIIREINDTGTSRISTKEKCIFVDTKNSEILKTSDALLFRILGIN